MPHSHSPEIDPSSGLGTSSTQITLRPILLGHDERGHLAHRIRNIPSEILIQIFLQYLELHQRSPPWYLSHICRSWRDIALHTPQLWTRIPLPPLSNRLRVAEALVAFLPEYLSRSRGQTITFNWEGNWDPASLEEEDLYDDPICGKSGVILDILIQHAERWGRVSIISSRWTEKFEQQLAHIHGCLDRLHYLELGSDSPHVMYVEAFRNAPRLTEVKLRAPLDSDLIGDLFPCNQLERVKLTVPSSSVLSHMDLFRDLIALDLECVGSEVPTFGSEVVEFPNLTELSLRSPSDLSANHFISLSCPRLLNFRIYSILAKPEPFSSFIHFLNHHSKSLANLTIGHIRFMYLQTSKPETRIDFTVLPFDELRNLVYLELHRPPLDKLLDFLNVISSGSLPRPLQILRIIFNDSPRLPHSYIKDVAEKLRKVVSLAEKKGSGVQLRRIIINPGDSNDYWEFLGALEGWPEEFTGELADAFVKLRTCEKELQKVYDFPYDNKDRVIAVVFDGGDTEKIKKCLEVMEMDIEDLTLLHTTRLHFIARALSEMSPDQFTPLGSNILSRASALVRHWEDLFEADVPNRRWMHCGSRKLANVPINDGLYRANLGYWMYGLKAGWETEELDDLF